MFVRFLVSPYALQLFVDYRPVANMSVFILDFQPSIDVTCEIYSYPRTHLELTWNNQTLSSINETLDCVNDDRSTTFLSTSLCSMQSNWRFRIRITTTIELTNTTDAHRLQCTTTDFPYGYPSAMFVQVRFLHGKG
jgi:hypothetical protein